KNTIVDVLCTDVSGRKFCVEMQMEWSEAFQQRVLFNASKLYVSQAKKGGKYSELQPVYSLNLINDIFAHDTPDFIHNYRIVYDKDSNKVIEGLHFTFIELPKFTPHSIADKRMMVLWLRFLTEINSNTKEIPANLLNDPEIGKAVEELEISGFTDAELWAYDKFWDSVSVERTLIDDSYQKGIEKGRVEGMEKGMNQRSLEIAKKMLANGMDEASVMDMTGLTAEEIKLLKAEM
uniref:Rpn family recombination-promoting nuclease/putative transposase n=2 Tax=Segatella hominis TaxID=2518605 RepID=UPI003AB7CD18